MTNDITPAPIGADALRVAAQAALTALENLHEIDTETECITIDVRDEIDALRSALASAAQPPAPAAQGDAQQRAMDARHAAIYRWIIQHIDKAASIIDAWREDGEADKDELHDALAARAAKEGAKHG